MRTNPLISNSEDMNHCSHRLDLFTQWLPRTSTYDPAQQQGKKILSAEFTASEEGTAGLHTSNAPHHDLESLLCAQEASIPQEASIMSGCARSFLHELLMHMMAIHVYIYTHTLQLMLWHRSYSTLFYLSPLIPGVTFYQLLVIFL